MSVSSCHDGSNHPLIDVLEVYARPHHPKTSLEPSGSSSRLSGGVAVADTPLSSALGANTVEALSACSRLLSHALGLASAAASPIAEATVGSDGPPEPRAAVVGDGLLRQLGDSALSVLCKTCLASDKARWRALRASSRSLLMAAQPDAARRVEAVHSAYTAEVTLALVGGGVGGGTSGGGAGGQGGGGGSGGLMEAPASPELLTRVAQLCVRVCMRRPELLREGLAPALAGGSGGDGEDQGKLSSRFVFPALVRRFWESCVWRRDDRSSTQMVLRCVLHLAVHELRAAGAATAAAATAAVTEGPVETQAASLSGDLHSTETDVLRAGLGELMPLLRSNVARVSQASSTYLTTLLLGAMPATTGLPGSSQGSQGVGAHGAGVGGGSFTQGGASGEPEPDDGSPGTGANVASAGASLGVASGSYAASAESMSEAEGRIETEATSNPGSDSDGDVEGESSSCKDGDGGGGGGRREMESSGRRVDPATTVQLTRGGLKRAAQLRSLLGAGEREGGVNGGDGAAAAARGGNPAAAGERASANKKSDPIAPPIAFGDLLSSSRKRARTSPSSDGVFGRGSAPRSGGGGAATDDDQAASRGSRADADAAARAADQKSRLPTGEPPSASGRKLETAEVVATTAAAAAAAAEVVAAAAHATSVAAAAGAAVAGNDAPGANAANSSKVCYRCDGCDDFPLQHVRHHCLVCADFDLCPQCYELCHGPNSQFQGGNVMTLGGHSTAHGMETVQVRSVLVNAVFAAASREDAIGVLTRRCYWIPKEHLLCARVFF